MNRFASHVLTVAVFLLILVNFSQAEPGRLLKTIPSSGTIPFGLAWTKQAGRSLLYVMDYSKQGYQVFDTRTGKPVGDIVHTGPGPRHGIAVVGDRYYAPYFDSATGDMVVASAKTGESGPQGVFVLKNAQWTFCLVHDGVHFWAAGARNTRKLFRFDDTGKILQSIEIGENIQSVAWGEGSLWVLLSRGAILRMDRSGKKLAEIKLPEYLPIAGDGRGIAWDAETKTLWVSSNTSVYNIQALTGYPALPSITVARCGKKPKLDGLSTDASWKQAEIIDSFKNLDGIGTPANRSHMRFCYDETNLYIYAECRLPAGKRPSARKLSRDADPWNDESLEILLSPYFDSGVYYQIVVNAAGSVFDKKWGRGVADGAGWNSGTLAKTSYRDGKWTMEASIPLKAIQAVRNGSIWRFQVYRNDFTAKLASSAFSPTITGKYHEPTQFGVLHFGKNGASITDLAVKDAFYDGWPIEASVLNRSTKPLKAKVTATVTSAKTTSSTATSVLLPSEQKLNKLSPVIKQDGIQKLRVSVKSADGSAVLSEAVLSPVGFDPFNMAGLRKMSASAKKEFTNLSPENQKNLRSGLISLGGELNAFTKKLSSGMVGASTRTAAQSTASSLHNRFNKLLLALKAAEAGWTNPDVVVCRAHTTDQLFPESKYIGDPIKTVSVSLAGRESESAQLVLLPVNRTLNGIEVTYTPPVSDDGSKLGMEVSRVGFVNTVKPPTDMDRVGLWPDPLLDIAPFDIPDDQLRCLWIRISAPAGARAGKYTGSITIKPAGSESVEVAVQANVWGFDLPLKPYLRTAFSLHIEMLNAVYGSSATEAFMNYTAQMLRNRISPSYNSVKVWYPDINFSYKNKPEDIIKPGLWDKAVEYIQYCNANGFSGFYDIAYLDKCYEGYADDYVVATMRFLRSFVPHLKSKGLLDQVGIYAWDEIEPENYDKHVQIATVIKKEFPDLPILMVQNHGSAAEILKGTVDIWVPYITTYWSSRDTYLKEQAAGRDVWWYICMYPFPGKLPCPNVYIDEPAIDLRIVHWMEYKFGVTGYLYWGVNYWEPAQKQVIREIDRSGILDWKTTEGTIMGNGEGYLFYPGPDCRPMLSMRMDNFRDGIEDYDMFTMLKDVVENPASGLDDKSLKKAKDLLAIPDAIVKSVGEYTPDISKLHAIRTQIAELLEKALGK